MTLHVLPEQAAYPSPLLPNQRLMAAAVHFPDCPKANPWK
jgi:hypothetical protein